MPSINTLTVTLLCCMMVNVASSVGDSDDISGLWNIISGSSQGQASIAVDASESDEDATLAPIEPSSVRTLQETTESFSSEDEQTSNAAIVDSQSLFKKVNGERELEKSHTDAKEIRIEQIKLSLLSKLQLDQLPNPGLVDLYSRFPLHILEGIVSDRRQMDEPLKEDNYHAKIDQMIRFAQEVPQEKSVRIAADKLNTTLYFPMPFSVTDGSLEKATLLVYIETPAGYEGEQVTFRVLTNPWLKVVTTRKVVLRKGGHWEHVDITEQCDMWVKNEWKNNLGLSVEAVIGGESLISYSNAASSNDSLARLPLVKLKLNEKEYNNRNKRSLHSDMPLSCHPEDNEKRCCRYPFVLDFDELGPDFKFIISPKRYWANYCKGMCPEYVLPANPNLQLTRGVNKAQRCCSPSAVDSLTLIYMNDNGDIVRGTIPGMSITSCGCD